MRAFLLASTFIWPAAAMADSFTLPMIPDAVTVYPSGATVHARTAVTAPAGTHDIKFLVPSAMLQGSLPEFNVLGAAVTGLSARHMPSAPIADYLTEGEARLAGQARTLLNAQRELESQIAGLQARRDAVQAQRVYLQAIKPATETPQSLEDLQAIAGYLPQALNDAAAAQADLDQQIRDIQHDLDDLRDDSERLDAAIQRAGLPREDWIEIVIDARQDTAGEIQVTMTGFAPDAGWRPAYDVRLDETASQITLERSAQVFQSTGQGWNGVQLTLSSAEPFKPTTPHLPRRDVVRLLQQAKDGVGYGSVSGRMAQPLAAPQILADTAGPVGKFDGVEVRFDLPGRQTVGTGDHFGGRAILPLDPLTLDVALDRYANARRDKAAFVRAQFINTTGQPILSGDGQFYRGDTLIGDHRIDLIAAGADADLFFGPDQTLPVTLKFLSERSGDQGFLSRSNTRTEEISVAVENLGPAPQDVVVTYALPVSTDEDIDVDLAFSTGPDRRDMDGEPGVVEWDLALPPGAAQTIGMTFELTWPEHSQIDWRP